MTSEMMDPTFLTELAHEGIDPGKSRLAVFPPTEVGFCDGVVDGVGSIGGPVGGGSSWIGDARG